MDENNWISTKDQLPELFLNEASSSVLLFNGLYIMIGFYDYEDEAFISNGRYFTATHWQPLPKPPKTDKTVTKI